jgi:hypothetical protein
VAALRHHTRPATAPSVALRSLPDPVLTTHVPPFWQLQDRLPGEVRELNALLLFDDRARRLALLCSSFGFLLVLLRVRDIAGTNLDRVAPAVLVVAVRLDDCSIAVSAGRLLTLPIDESKGSGE